MRSSWHHWELEKVFSVLQSQPSGISYTAARRRLRGGKPKRLSYLLAIVLVLGLLVFPFTRSLLFSRTSLLSLFVVVFHGVIYRSFVLAKKSLLSFDSFIPRAVVKRDDRYIVIPSRNLAPGDMVRIQPGDWVEADMRLVVLKDLVVARGEKDRWQVQMKDTTAPLPPDLPEAEQSNMVYGGSLVVAGEAMGIVVKTPKRGSLGVELPSLMGLGSGWLVFGLVFLFVAFRSVELTIVYLVLILSVPCHWFNILEFSLLKGSSRLKEAGVIVRHGLILLGLSKTDKVIVDLNNYDLAGKIDVKFVGLWHGQEEREIDNIPVLQFMEGLALPRANCLTLVTNTPQDKTLATDVMITSDRATPELQRQSGIVFKENDLGLLETSIKEGRITIDRVRRILLLSCCGGLSLLILLAAGVLLGQTTITPVQMMWSGVFLPTGLSLLLLLEPDPAVVPPRVVNFLDKYWFFILLTNVAMVCLLTAVVFRFASVSLSWTVFNFSLLALGASLLRGQFTNFYQFWLAYSGVLIIQILWIQTARSGMVPLNIWSWAIGIVVTSGVFWLNEILRVSNK